MFGVTVDRTENLSSTIAALRRLKNPWVRLVCDPGVSPQEYSEAMRQLTAVSEVMLCPIDSFAANRYNREQYVQRINEFATYYKRDAGIIEVANEINGDWLGKYSDLRAERALEWVLNMGLTTAVTFFKDDSLRPWIEAWSPKMTPHYAFLSCYERGREYEFTRAKLKADFDYLAAMFPASRIGVGEFGCEGENQEPITDDELEILLRKYYESLALGKYCHGGFYWDFVNLCSRHSPWISLLEELEKLCL